MASLDRTETTKSEVSRQRILDAAAKTFRDKGYVATRLQDIAEAAGLRAGSIYYHFASKEQILEAVFDIGTTRLRQSVSDAVALLPATASHRDRIFAAARTHLSTLLGAGRLHLGQYSKLRPDSRGDPDPPPRGAPAL